MGKLSIVATPIGNMGDLTFRALWNLKICDVIFSEDTRVTKKLLGNYGLRKPIHRLDAATEMRGATEIVERVSRGEHVCYVVDAGTPGISDPGTRLVKYVRANMPEVKIEAIPGPSALPTALSVAGIEVNQFLFLGFLPNKKGRKTAIEKLAASDVPVVLYESPHRIIKLLGELEVVAPRATVTLARELTKIHEEVVSGNPRALAELLAREKKERGEFVVIVDTRH